MESVRCDCCGEIVDGLFPIFDNKDEYGERPEHSKKATWCGTCFERGDCKTPYGGACYKHEGEDEWWDGERWVSGWE